MDSHQPLTMKKNCRAKKTSTKAQEMCKEAKRKGLKAPRMDVHPLQEVSAEEFKRAKREETWRLKRDLWVFKEGEKKPYLQERGRCPALAQIREAASKAQRSAEKTNSFASSFLRASGGEGPCCSF